MSRAARDNFKAAGGVLSDDAAAVTHRETAQRGGLWAAGVGGPITGKGFHLGIIDDPLKNAEEAASETIRAKQKDWYRSTFLSRQEPGAAIVVVQTRWNEDDLSGWLLSEEGSEEPEHWRVISMPAIAESEPRQFPPTCTVDADWRKPGEPLCPERYPLRRLEQFRVQMGSYFWSALYQQRPTPLEGGLFKRAWFTVIHALPVGCRFVRYWDKASTPGGGDWTAGALWARSPAGRFIAVDMRRGQWSPGEREAIIKQTAELDRLTYSNVATRGEQEPGSSGVESAQNTARNLAGFDVRFERVTGDKLTRAQPLAAQCEAGNVDMLAGSWNAVFLDELCTFPNGRYDDQVDSSSGAFAKLVVPAPRAAVSRQG
jgi:predicted phage terminase large subunit-like protein